MKRFLIRLMAFSAILATVIAFLIVFRLYLTSKIDWHIPANKTVVFMGASQVSRDVDFSLMENAYNLSKPSERYIFTYAKLRKIIENNPQVKTVVLQCAPTDLWQNSDDKYFVENEMSEFVPLFYPLLDKEMLHDYSGHYVDMIKFIIQHSLDFQDFKGRRYLGRIGFGYQSETLLEGTFDRSSVTPKMIQGEYGNKVNIKYLHKIIDYCNQHELILYLIYFPMYHPEYFYDQDYYYERIKELGDVNYLDYSHFEMDDSLRFDAHHLNKNGAAVFTRQLCKDLNVTYTK